MGFYASAKSSMGRLWEGDAHMYPIPMGVSLGFPSIWEIYGLSHSTRRLWEKNIPIGFP